MNRKGIILCVAVLSVVCAVLLVVGGGAEEAGTVVNSGSCGDDLTWTLYEDGLFEINGTGPMWDYDITWGDNRMSWYSERGDILSIVIHNGVTHIGNDAFHGCLNAVSLILPESLEDIGTFSFGGCESLKDVVIPDSVKSIGYYSFADCFGLESLTLGTGVETICPWGFISCRSLRTVHLPASLSDFRKPFGKCISLTEFTVDPDNPYFCAVDGVLFSKDMESLEQFPAGKGGSYTIPAGVALVRETAFENNDKLTEVVIPSSVKKLENGVFLDCFELSKVTIQDGLAEIGDWAFKNCVSLEEITFPAGVSCLDGMPFTGCQNLTKAEFHGDAPKVTDRSFGSSNVIVYYDPTTEGWSYPVWNTYLTCPIGETLVFSYPASGETGDIITGTIIGEEKGWDGSIGSGAASAFDGNPSTIYDPTALGGSENYCGIKAPITYTLTKAAVLSRYIDEDSTSRLIGAKIQGSNDGESWTTLYTFTAASQKGVYTVVADFQNNTGYTMYRYFNDVNHGDVAEVEFYGFSTYGEPMPVSGITLDRKTAELNVGETLTLTAKVTPDNAADKSVTWTSSDPSVAAVENGVVTAHAEGSAAITVTTTDGGLTAECLVTVNAVPMPDEIIRGDVDGDGYLDSDDAIYLLRYTLNASRYPINQSGDMDGDNDTDSDDAIYLLRHTLNKARYPLKNPGFGDTTEVEASLSAKSAIFVRTNAPYSQDTALIRAGANLVETARDHVVEEAALTSINFCFANNTQDPNGFRLTEDTHNTICADGFAFGDIYASAMEGWNAAVFFNGDSANYIRVTGSLGYETYAPHPGEELCSMLKAVSIPLPKGRTLRFPTRDDSTDSQGRNYVVTLVNCNFMGTDKEGTRQIFRFEVAVTVYCTFNPDNSIASSFITFDYTVPENQTAGSTEVVGFQMQ